MYFIRLIFGLILILSNSAFSTVFIPASIHKQIEAASFGVEVEVIKKTPFKNDNGYIYTRYDFKVVESFGANLDFFNLEIPGGTLGDIGTSVDGAPQFKNGVKYFLLIKEIENKYYLSNFTLGQYEVQRIGDQVYYVSSVFPFDKEMGRTNKEIFKKIMIEKWNLVSRIDKNFPKENITASEQLKKLSKKQEPERKIASEESLFNLKKWYVYFLAFICIGISIYLINRRWNEK